MDKRIIIYTIVIVIILAAVFFSQQTYSRDIIKNIFSSFGKYGGASLLGAVSSNSPNALNTNSSNNSPTKALVGDASTSASLNGANAYKLTPSAYNSPATKTAPSVDLAVVEKAKMATPSIPEKVAEGLKSGGEVIVNSVNGAKENISNAGKNIINYFSGISNAIQGKENNSSTCQCPAGQ